MKNPKLSDCKKTCVIVQQSPRRPSEQFVTVQNELWAWCRKNNKPFVHVILSKKHASISMDLPNGSGHMDDEGRAELRTYLVSVGYADRPLSAISSSIEEIPLDKVDAVAVELVKIAQRFCDRRKPIS